MKPDSCVFTIHKLLKTSRPGKHATNLTFTAYSPDNRLCPIVCLCEYAKRTSKLRTGSDQLLVSIQKSHKPVSTHTISRWLKTVLEKAGIDTSVFKAHTTRAPLHLQLPFPRFLCLLSWTMQAGWMQRPLENSTRNSLSQQLKLMDSFCWRTSTHRNLRHSFYCIP